MALLPNDYFILVICPEVVIISEKALYSAIHPICHNVLKMRIWEFPRLVGRYCSYLLPKQSLATFSDNLNKTFQ